MEKLYLLGLFEFSMIFQDLENIVFCAMNSVLEELCFIKGFWCDAGSKLAEILSHWGWELTEIFFLLTQKINM